jgi:hypothetical protein
LNQTFGWALIRWSGTILLVVLWTSGAGNIRDGTGVHKGSRKGEAYAGLSQNQTASSRVRQGRLWMGIDIPHPDSALCVSRHVTSAESTAASSAASFPT